MIVPSPGSDTPPIRSGLRTLEVATEVFALNSDISKFEPWKRIPWDGYPLGLQVVNLSPDYPLHLWQYGIEIFIPAAPKAGSYTAWLGYFEPVYESSEVVLRSNLDETNTVLPTETGVRIGANQDTSPTSLDFWMWRLG